MVMKRNTASSTNAELEIVHAVRGRIRLRLKGDDVRELLSRIADLLRQQGGINVVQIKPTSNSLVVTFDPDAISIEQLIGSLQSFNSIEISAETISRSRGESHAMTYGRLLSLVPPLVGLGIARGLKVSGWKSILTYILAVGVTREVIDQITGESEKLEENVELSPAKVVSVTDIKAEEISTLLTVIETDYEIVHHIPGRIRLRVPRISRDYASRSAKGDRSYAQELKRLLEQDKRIIDVRLKINNSSVVILYDLKALADSISEKTALDDSQGNRAIQSVDTSENSSIPDQTTENDQATIESDLNDNAPPSDENSSKVEIEAESSKTNTDDESLRETDQEFTNEEKTIKAGYWSNFKSSMLLTMLHLMGNPQVQTAAEI